jgi:hypothetical protein
MATGGIDDVVGRGAIGADEQHPPTPTTNAHIPHHQRMAILADTMSGIGVIGWWDGPV